MHRIKTPGVEHANISGRARTQTGKTGVDANLRQIVSGAWSGLAVGAGGLAGGLWLGGRGMALGITAGVVVAGVVRFGAWWEWRWANRADEGRLP